MDTKGIKELIDQMFAAGTEDERLNRYFQILFRLTTAIDAKAYKVAGVILVILFDLLMKIEGTLIEAFQKLEMDYVV